MFGYTASAYKQYTSINPRYVQGDDRGHHLQHCHMLTLKTPLILQPGPTMLSSVTL